MDITYTQICKWTALVNLAINLLISPVYADSYAIVADTPDRSYIVQFTELLKKEIRIEDKQANFLAEWNNANTPDQLFLLGINSCKSHKETKSKKTCLFIKKKQVKDAPDLDANIIFLDTDTKTKIKKIKQQFLTNKPIAITSEESLPDTIYIDLTDKRKINRQIKSLKNKTDILLILPESNVFDNETAKAILLNSYNNGIGIVGYSPSMTKSGAIASFHNNLGKLAKEAASVNKQETIYQGYSKEISTSLNKAIAKSLGIETRE